MAVERTLSIIKPDAVKRDAIGRILSRFEAAGLKIIAARMMHLSRAEAEGFYAVHRERSFFRDLVEFMTSGPVLVQVLEGDIAHNDASNFALMEFERNEGKALICVATALSDVVIEADVESVGQRQPDIGCRTK